MTKEETDNTIIKNKDCNMKCTQKGYIIIGLTQTINCDCYYYKQTDINLNFYDYVQECCSLYNKEYLKRRYGQSIYERILEETKIKKLKEILA